jgi:hypothetical protein
MCDLNNNTAVHLFHAAMSFDTSITNLYIPIYVISFEKSSTYVQAPLYCTDLIGGM